ncbi:NAD(P)H-hydrate dehydratase [Oribacterium sp. Sow4_G1_1]|uniref:NAD(P)H-hydrate dehydratase n=1 Tax=Oribacterium sp. Sow4_G1_1 TaxID=3438794 RepID=UPI003F960806
MDTDKTTYLKKIPARRSDSNKGTYGKILVAAGSEGMCGAAYLAGLAAYRSGAGLVRILTPASNRLIVQSLLLEAIFTGYDSDSNFRVLSEANVSWADILVLGPGLGTEALSVTLVRELLQAIAAQCDAAPSKWLGKFPLLLIDADGLNILSVRPELMQLVDQIARQIPVVVTPHPMEMARLSAVSLQEILQCPAHAAEALAAAHGTITVMKGSETIVLDADGHAFQNLEASPALSKGGSGDVLSGAIAGVYAVLRADRIDALNEVPPEEQRTRWRRMAFDAAVTGVLLHAEAGRQAANIHGTHGVLARETADMLGIVMHA